MNAERRPGQRAASEAAGGPSSIIARSDARLDLWDAPTGCQECGGRLGVPKPGRTMCPQCHRDYLAGLRRLHAAELRAQPLSDLSEAS